MKVRLIEVPLCGVCNRDGIALKVTNTATGQGFMLFRCQSHLDRLMREADDAEPTVAPRKAKASSNGHAEATEGLERLSPDTIAVLRAIVDVPGLAARQYAEALPDVDGRLVSSRAQTLRQRGLVRIEGRALKSRLFPTRAGADAVMR